MLAWSDENIQEGYFSYQGIPLLSIHKPSLKPIIIEILMKKTPHFARTLINTSILAIISSNAVHAGAFSLYTESSGAAVGNYAAGIAAEAADASTAWYNPAGLMLLKKQEVVFSGVGVFPSSQLTGISTFNTPNTPTFAPYVQSFNHLQGAESALVPALHYALPLTEHTAFGASIVAPFGLATDWGTESPTRYAATRTQLHTIDVSSDLASQLTKTISFGAGLDVQWAEVKFNGVLGSPAVLQAFQSEGYPLTPTTYDSTSDNQGSSWGFGFHTGLLGAFNDQHTRIGVNYQSKIAHRFSGSSTLTGRLADALITDPTAVFSDSALLSNDVDLPDVLTLSAYQDVNDKFALLGSLVYTGWSTFNEIQLTNIAAFSAALDGQVLAASTAEEQYRNAWRMAIGANYQVNDQWMMRIGGGYDQTPTVNSERDIRLPDANRWALSVGAHYQFRPNVGVDIGYAYLFALNNATINKTQPVGSVSTVNVAANAKVHAQLVGLQVVWALDKVAWPSMSRAEK